MGNKELLSLSCDTFDHADMVVRIVPVIEMSLTDPTFPIIDENTLYFRKDFTLMRSWTNNMVTLLEVCYNHIFYELHSFLFQGNGQSMCRVGCQFEGMYRPGHDIIRYCTDCKRWYHTACLNVSGMQQPTLLRALVSRPKQPELPKNTDDSVPMEGHLFTLMHLKFWQKILLSPIQRGYRNRTFPLSFESLVYAIRFQQRTGGCPPDVFAFIDAELNVAPHLLDKAELYRGIFLEMPKHIYYRCAGCTSYL